MTRFLPALFFGIGILCLGAPAIGWAAPSELPEMLMGSEIQELLSGNTVSGTMAKSGPYTDFYQRDGTVKGRDYSGTWTIENNNLCVKADASGADKNCWQVNRKGNLIQWLSGGKIIGTGTVAAGNPHNL